MKKTVLLLASLLLVSPAFAAVFKIATIAPEGSQWMQMLRGAADDIGKQTDGRVTVKYYGGGVMGNDKKVLRKIRIGQLQGGAFTASGLAERYPDIVLYGLPMMFRSQAEVDYVRGILDADLMTGLEKSGFVSFGFAGGGFALIMGNRPVIKEEDLHGQKVWVPDGDAISYRVMESLQLSPVALPIGDVLTGLQTGLLDVVATPPVGALLLQWHTKLSYVTTQPMAYTLGILAIDKRAFDALSPADQAIFRAVMGSTYKQLDEVNRNDNTAAIAALKAAGLKFVDPSPEVIPVWKQAADQTNERIWSGAGYTPELLARMRDALAEYRSGQTALSAAQ